MCSGIFGSPVAFKIWWGQLYLPYPQILIDIGLPAKKLGETRPVVPGGVGGTMAPPDLGKSVNPISTKGDRLCPPNNTGPQGFSDLPTALETSPRKSPTRMRKLLSNVAPYMRKALLLHISS